MLSGSYLCADASEITRPIGISSKIICFSLVFQKKETLVKFRHGFGRVHHNSLKEPFSVSGLVVGVNLSLRTFHMCEDSSCDISRAGVV